MVGKEGETVRSADVWRGAVRERDERVAEGSRTVCGPRWVRGRREVTRPGRVAMAAAVWTLTTVAVLPAHAATPGRAGSAVAVHGYEVFAQDGAGAAVRCGGVTRPHVIRRRGSQRWRRRGLHLELLLPTFPLRQWRRGRADGEGAADTYMQCTMAVEGGSAQYSVGVGVGVGVGDERR